MRGLQKLYLLWSQVSTSVLIQICAFYKIPADFLQFICWKNRNIPKPLRILNCSHQNANFWYFSFLLFCSSKFHIEKILLGRYSVSAFFMAWFVHDYSSRLFAESKDSVRGTTPYLPQSDHLHSEAPPASQPADEEVEQCVRASTLKNKHCCMLLLEGMRQTSANSSLLRKKAVCRRRNCIIVSLKLVLALFSNIFCKCLQRFDTLFLDI